MLYVNPGYIELLNGTTSGRTVLNNNNVCFYNTANNAANLTFTGCKELWIKCNFIYKSSSPIRFYLSTSENKVVGIVINIDGVNAYNFWNNDNIVARSVAPRFGSFVDGTEYEILMHVKSDSSDGKFELYINDFLEYSASGNVQSGNEIVELEIQGDGTGVRFRNLIIADFDITDYHIAQCDIKSYTTDFEQQTDGPLKAAAAGEYISATIDTDALETEIKKNVTSAEIIGVNVSAFNVSYDSSVINALKSSIDGTDSENLTITNNNVAGKVLTVNPALSKAWTLDQLKTAVFKLTAEKV